MPKPIDDGLILEVIDRGLSSLGERPKQALWYCLEKDFKFNHSKVPENMEAFEETLKDFFGLGYRFLECLFRKYLQEATGEDLKNYKTFAECVNVLRRKNENKDYLPKTNP